MKMPIATLIPTCRILILSLFMGSTMGSIVSANSSLAGELDRSNRGMIQTYRSMPVDGDHYGNQYEFELQRTRNNHDELTLAVVLVEHRLLMPPTRVAVLYGRDTDGDNRIDTWFIPTGPATMDYLVRPSKVMDGWDVAEDLLKNVIHVHNRNPFGMLIRAVQQNLTINGGITLAYFDELQTREMDLYDLESRADQVLAVATQKLPPEFAKDPEIRGKRKQLLLEARETYSLTSQGWTELDRQISEVGQRNFFIATVADMALAGIAGGIAKGASVLAEWIGVKLTSTAAGELAVKAFTAFADRVSGSVSRVTSKLRLPVLNAAAQKVGQNAIVHYIQKTIPEQVASKIEVMEAKNSFTRLGAHALNHVGMAFKGAAHQLPYIAITQGLQAGIEIATRPDIGISMEHPIVMTKRAFSNKEFQQDFGYMTVETIMQTGIHAGFEKEWSMKKRLAIVGLMSFVDSNVMNFAVKHETDKGRITLDTAWEVTYGNGQTFMDQKMLKISEELAEKQGNPKLKLLGFAFAIVDQASGYYFYSKASQWYEKNPKNVLKTKMNELFGGATKSNPAVDQKLDPKASSIVMIPVLGEKG